MFSVTGIAFPVRALRAWQAGRWATMRGPTLAERSSMAGASLFTLLDDIASLLDDISVLTKVAAKKTVGVLGDDLALNAQQVTGVRADRELPVVWAVAKGSLRNKAILVPLALAISAWLPWLVMPLMMVGGAYLCFEGVEKLAHRFLHPAQDEAARRAERLQALADASTDLVAMEKTKVAGAIRTDFVLSAEIIVLALGVIPAGTAFVERLAVLVAVALAMTVGVYGVVAAIVKLDDLGAWLLDKGRASARLGRGILRAVPWLMKGLSVAGTVAMFLVGGGIVVHGVPAVHHAIGDTLGRVLAGGIADALGAVVVGLAVGTVVLLAVQAWQWLRGRAGGGH